MRYVPAVCLLILLRRRNRHCSNPTDAQWIVQGHGFGFGVLQLDVWSQPRESAQ